MVSVRAVVGVMPRSESLAHRHGAATAGQQEPEHLPSILYPPSAVLLRPTPSAIVLRPPLHRCPLLSRDACCLLRKEQIRTRAAGQT
eukprot:1258808-Rhodomonas_salina.1